jgi:hypothetical protein
MESTNHSKPLYRQRWLYVIGAFAFLVTYSALTEVKNPAKVPTAESQSSTPQTTSSTKNIRRGLDVDYAPEPWGLKLGEDIRKKFPECRRTSPASYDPPVYDRQDSRTCWAKLSYNSKDNRDVRYDIMNFRPAGIIKGQQLHDHLSVTQYDNKLELIEIYRLDK